MRKVIAPQAVNALIDALSCVYWFKPPLKRFIVNSITGSDLLRLVNSINFEDATTSKRAIVERIFNYIGRDQGQHTTDLLALLENISNFNDYSHFNHPKIENPEERIQTAKRAVAAVRECVKPYIDDIQRGKEILRERERNKQDVAAKAVFSHHLKSLHDNYCKLVCSSEKQTRGYALEKLLFQLFTLFNLDPTPPFKTKFDQIDGAFSFDGTEYLLEAKWTDGFSTTVELDAFDSQINSRTLDNTLGVFISINGFAPSAIEAYSNRRHRLLLVQGNELINILRGETSLPELLKEKKKQASRQSKAG